MVEYLKQLHYCYCSEVTAVLLAHRSCFVYVCEEPISSHLTCDLIFMTVPGEKQQAETIVITE